MSGRSLSHILVVDDEPAYRELLVDALSSPSVQVDAVGSGREALDLIKHQRPNIVITDLCLGDCNGLDVIDQMRAVDCDVPTVVITGYGDAETLSEASRRQPIELLNKPLDIERLRATVRGELNRQLSRRRARHRTVKLRQLARNVNIERKQIRRQLDTTCADLTNAYRQLSGRLSLQGVLIGFQHQLLTFTKDDDVFRSLFRLFVSRSGPIFGITMVCDETAQLRIAGRFGVPYPDNARFCELLSEPIADTVIVNPNCTMMDAGENTDMFDPAIRKYLVGISILTMPLKPSEDRLIGLVMLYRKGEQPFTDEDVALAETLAQSTALTLQRID